MLLLKIALTILVVSGLSLVAERISPRAAGVLSAYPAGTAISLFFIALEQGPAFAGQSAPYNVAGITAMLLFLSVYYQVSHALRRPLPLVLSVALPSLAAVTGFSFATLVLYRLRLEPLAGIPLTGVSILAAAFFFRRIPNAAIANRVRLGPRVLLFRAVAAAVVIVAITGAAYVVRPGLAGLLTAFPATVFPLIIIVHSTYGPAQAHTIIKNFPQGAGALVFYSLTVAAAYPLLGIGWGTLAAFGAATLYLAAILLAFPKTAIINTK